MAEKTNVARHARATAEATARRAYRALELLVRRPQPEDQLVADAQAYWNGDDQLLHQNAHVRGAGVFADDERWLTMGRRHLEMFTALSRVAEPDAPFTQIVEWGCGGGANLVAFAPLTTTYVGVDISAEALDACDAEARRNGFDGFVPTLVDAAAPETALALERARTDLFLCTYVLELVPTPAYGLRLMAIAAELLTPGGLAFVQVKYSVGRRSSRSRPWDYGRNLASNTSYAIDDFWTSASDLGLEPLAVSLLPVDDLTGDGRYAYFLLRRR